MGLEASATYIDSLVQTNPDGAVDPASELDDHIRLIKGALLRTFPNITGEVSASAGELNAVAGLTGGILGQVVAYRTASLTLTNDVSMTADPALQITLSESGGYMLDFALNYNGASNFPPNGKWLCGCAGETHRVTVAYGYNWGVTAGQVLVSSATHTLSTLNATGLRLFASGNVQVDTPPVTLGVKWAQLSASSVGVSMLSGSYIRAIKAS